MTTTIATPRVEGACSDLNTIPDDSHLQGVIKGSEEKSTELLGSLMARASRVAKQDREIVQIYKDHGNDLAAYKKTFENKNDFLAMVKERLGISRSTCYWMMDLAESHDRLMRAKAFLPADHPCESMNDLRAFAAKLKKDKESWEILDELPVDEVRQLVDCAVNGDSGKDNGLRVIDNPVLNGWDKRVEPFFNQAISTKWSHVLTEKDQRFLAEVKKKLDDFIVVVRERTAKQNERLNSGEPLFGSAPSTPEPDWTEEPTPAPEQQAPDPTPASIAIDTSATEAPEPPTEELAAPAEDKPKTIAKLFPYKGKTLAELKEMKARMEALAARYKDGAEYSEAQGWSKGAYRQHLCRVNKAMSVAKDA